MIPSRVVKLSSALSENDDSGTEMINGLQNPNVVFVELLPNNGCVFPSG